MSDMPEDIMKAARKVVIEDLGMDSPSLLQTSYIDCIAEAILAERERSRQLLSEAEKREREARDKALGDAAEAIFVMGAWSPKYEKLTPNAFDEGASAAYEIVRELQGKAENALQSEAK